MMSCVLPLTIDTKILPCHFLPPNASTGAGPEPLTLVWWSECSTNGHWHHDLVLPFSPSQCQHRCWTITLDLDMMNWVFCYWLFTPWSYLAIFSLPMPAQMLDYNPWPWYDELSVLLLAIHTMILPSHFLPPNASTGAGPEPLTLVWWIECYTTGHWHHDLILSFHYLPPGFNGNG